MKIVVNRCFGGFTLSSAQMKLFNMDSPYGYSDDDDSRINPILIKSVLDGDNGGDYSDLYVVEIPDGVHWQIYDYDGSESVIWSESEIHWA